MVKAVRALVSGLELGASAKLVVSCDFCPATFGKGYLWSQRLDLIRDARLAGWTGSLTKTSNNDRCPACRQP